MTNFNDVGAFHSKFGLPRSIGVLPGCGCGRCPGPRQIPAEVLEFRANFLQEELDEFRAAMREGDHAGMADALVDLVYVALGTAHLQGYPWEVLWDEVQRANMGKERAQPDASNSKRGSSWDVIKPEGWRPPDIGGILKRFGF